MDRQEYQREAARFLESLDMRAEIAEAGKRPLAALTARQDPACARALTVGAAETSASIRGCLLDGGWPASTARLGRRTLLRVTETADGCRERRVPV
jgi:hypothetical protein